MITAARRTTHFSGIRELRLSMRAFLLVAFLAALLYGAEDNNLVANGDLEKRDPAENRPEGWELNGRAIYVYHGNQRNDYSSMGVSLNAGPQVGSSDPYGSLSTTVKNLDPKAGRWFRFSIRGFPQEQFALEKTGDIFLRADFFGDDQKDYYDGVTKSLRAQLDAQRRDLDVNGDYRRDGSAAWHNYTLDFKLPFPQVTQVKLTVGFNHGATKIEMGGAFSVDDLSLTRIPDPPEADAKKTVIPPRPLGTAQLIAGNWYYDARNGETAIPRRFDSSNADRLFYKAGRWETPFAGNVSAWMRAGFKDLRGATLTQDRYVPDSVMIEFTSTHMILHCKNLPNHPTARFPEERGNPNYIQEQDYTYYIVLNPGANPEHASMNGNNSNRALHSGSVGIAVNGVVFYNPFDAETTDATNMMDRCCGHPSPDNRYHYHKYPVCLKSPWMDEGTEHSRVIGWAFDGYPIYGPYESAGLLARDLKGARALNEFNIHYDSERGWHYHVTPGKFPYVIGGFWGVEDSRNRDKMSPPPPPNRQGNNQLPPDWRPGDPLPPRLNGERPPPPPPRNE